MKGGDGASYELTATDWAMNYWTVIARQLETAERDALKAGDHQRAEGARMMRQAIEGVRPK